MINFIKSATRKSEYPISHSEVVVVGRSNVGKSSLINALYHQKLANVGKNPGKTKLLNFFDIDGKYTLADVPGYGFANRSQSEIVAFGKLMEEYFASRRALCLVIMIVDIRHKPTKDDLEMLEFLRRQHHKIIIVANKSDKLSYSKRIQAISLIAETLNIPKEHIYPCSALKKVQTEELRQMIDAEVMKGVTDVI